MGFSLIHLVEFFVLIANSLAILNEKRFLRRFGMDHAQVGGDGGVGSLKNQAATLLHAMRTFMKYPLILVNVLCILYECTLG